WACRLTEHRARLQGSGRHGTDGRAGAGEGDRTLVCSLGSCRSTIELRPLGHPSIAYGNSARNRLGPSTRLRFTSAWRVSPPRRGAALAKPVMLRRISPASQGRSRRRGYFPDQVIWAWVPSLSFEAST